MKKQEVREKRGNQQLEKGIERGVGKVKESESNLRGCLHIPKLAGQRLVFPYGVQKK